MNNHWNSVIVACIAFTLGATLWLIESANPAKESSANYLPLVKTLGGCKGQLLLLHQVTQPIHQSPCYSINYCYSILDRS
jgi:hypothetical protein